MKRLNIISEMNVDVLIKQEMCCPQRPVKEASLFRTCVSCKNNMIEIKEFNGTDISYYDSWMFVIEEGRDRKNHRHNVKEKVESEKHAIVSKFINELMYPYMKHVGNIRHQCRVLKTRKSQLTTTDLFLHIDFAENFSCKYVREIQAVHFGSNRTQVTIHTGVLYTGF